MLRDVVDTHGGETSIPKYRLVLNHGKELDLQRYNAPNCSMNQVAAIITGAFDLRKEYRTLSVSLKNGNGLFTTILIIDPNADPMTYPVLFPRGDVGWSYHQPPRDLKYYDEEYTPYKDPTKKTRKKRSKKQANPSFHDDEAHEGEDEPTDDDEDRAEEIFTDPEAAIRKAGKKHYTLRDHYSYLLSYRAEEVAEPIPPPPPPEAGGAAPKVPPVGMFSPIHHGGRLAQQFVVDSFAKIEEHALNQVTNPVQQKKIRAEMYCVLTDHIRRRAAASPGTVEPGKAIVVPSSFVGSPRYMSLTYNKAMAMAMNTGPVDTFLTMTSNPKWKEVQENLLPGQKAEDRPDLIARVFKLKVDELLKDLFVRCIFGEVAGYAWTIEYQKRGLPHLHILLIHKNKIEKLRKGTDIDLMVSAEIPDKRIDPVLHNAVQDHMIHGPCGDLDPHRRGGGELPQYRRSQKLLGRTLSLPPRSMLENLWVSNQRHVTLRRESHSPPPQQPGGAL